VGASFKKVERTISKGSEGVTEKKNESRSEQQRTRTTNTPAEEKWKKSKWWAAGEGGRNIVVALILGLAVRRNIQLISPSPGCSRTFPFAEVAPTNLRMSDQSDKRAYIASIRYTIYFLKNPNILLNVQYDCE
jgi:hypothetical protein